MNASQLFSGRAYSFGLDKDIPKGEASYRFVTQVLSKSNLDIDVEHITQVECNENFDVYKVSAGGLLYCVKISLDKDCQHIKNEIDFYKNNPDSEITPQYLDSGHIKIGTDLIFLICSFDNGFSIEDDGLLSVIDNNESFFYTLYCFSELKTDFSFSEYLSLYNRDTKLKEASEILSQNVAQNYELQAIQDVFDLLTEEALKTSEKLNKKDLKCCHGYLGIKSIVTRDGLYKLKDFNYSFMGNKFFDLCFFCVFSGLSKNNSLILFEKYCDFNDLDLIENKNDYNSCMNICSCLFFSRILFDYLIEETIFETRRPERLFSICLDFSKSFHNLKRLKCQDLVSETLKLIITRPILES